MRSFSLVSGNRPPVMGVKTTVEYLLHLCRPPVRVAFGSYVASFLKELRQLWEPWPLKW